MLEEATNLPIVDVPDTKPPDGNSTEEVAATTMPEPNDPTVKGYEKAALEIVLQPNVPPLHVKAFEALLQLASPAPLTVAKVEEPVTDR